MKSKYQIGTYILGTESVVCEGQKKKKKKKKKKKEENSEMSVQVYY